MSRERYIRETVILINDFSNDVIAEFAQTISQLARNMVTVLVHSCFSTKNQAVRAQGSLHWTP